MAIRNTLVEHCNHEKIKFKVFELKSWPCPFMLIKRGVVIIGYQLQLQHEQDSKDTQDKKLPLDKILLSESTAEFSTK